jgi:hypothetical protein
LVAPSWPDDPDKVTQPLTLITPGRTKEQTLHLRVLLYCCADSSGRFLSVDESQFALGLADVPDPLFRYEYERK